MTHEMEYICMHREELLVLSTEITLHNGALSGPAAPGSHCALHCHLVSEMVLNDLLERG